LWCLRFGRVSLVFRNGNTSPCTVSRTVMDSRFGSAGDQSTNLAFGLRSLGQDPRRDTSLTHTLHERTSYDCLNNTKRLHVVYIYKYSEKIASSRFSRVPPLDGSKDSGSLRLMLQNVQWLAVSKPNQKIYLLPLHQKSPASGGTVHAAKSPTNRNSIQKTVLAL
jgi:hypothetical protein